MAMTSLYPLSSKEELQRLFVGKSLRDMPTPTAVLDISKVKANCQHMLESVKELGFTWRAHIKTHKTTELTRLSLGEGNCSANIIVSTVVEAENVLPMLLELKAAGRSTNILYGFPLTYSTIDRLALISGYVGKNGLSIMIDHPDQLPYITAINAKCGNPVLVFLKIDMGTQRAGVTPSSPLCTTLLSDILALEAKGQCILHGLYSHAGHSYSSSSPAAALGYLNEEFQSLLAVSQTVKSLSPSHTLVLSVGATPTTSSIKNLLSASSSTTSAGTRTAITALQTTIAELRFLKHEIEVHAGVFTTLDIQQLATHSVSPETFSYDNIALTILADVASIYPSRGASSTPEALITAGSLALGREPCKAYPGYAILTPWNRPGAVMPDSGPEGYRGWIVGRVSQEHGIVTWMGELEKAQLEKGNGGLEVGMKVRVWPNHACITSAGHDWYVIVDSSKKGSEDVVIDVWPRWRGW